MNNSPKISVIIATYNREKHIRRAIDSVLNQTYQNTEVIIVDGSPNNKTEKIAKSYLSDSRVRYFHKKEIHTGSGEDRANIAKARNKAIEISKGKYIAILDDDDIWCDERKLEKQIQFLKNHPDYVACGGGVIKIQQRDQRRPYIYDLPLEKDEEIRKAMLLNWGWCTHSTLVFRKDVGWEKAGGYSTKNPHNEDCEFMLRLGRFGKLYNFREYFSYFLIGEQNEPHWKKYPRNRIMSNIYLIKQYRNHYPGYPKAILWAWIMYFYLFLPLSLREFIRPIASRGNRFIVTPLINKIFKSE